MKAAVVLQYGETDPAIEIREDWPKPERKPNKKELLIKVLSCATAFGDVHMLSGRLSLIIKPPSFPYVPGKDICGIVEEADANSKFKVGDIVAASRDFACCGGMAEFAVVEEARSCLKPQSVDVLSGAACADSAITALKAAESAEVKEGERVLVLGGSGGVGSSLVQNVLLNKPSLLAATSTQKDMLTGLGVHQVIDYRSSNWWEMDEFKKKPFDVLIDCVGGNEHYVKSQAVLKSKKLGGRFVAVTGDEPLPQVTGFFQLLSFAGVMLKNPMKSTFNSSIPAYKMVVSGTTHECLAKVLGLMEGGKLKMVFDPCSPLEFTADGVKAALSKQASGRTHGKVVVRISDIQK